MIPLGQISVSVPEPTPADRPFAGQQVAIAGRLSLLSKRDTRALVERLGGLFAGALTARTTIVVLGSEPPELPSQVQRVLSEDDLCREAGLPDLEALRAQYYAARDLRGMYPRLRDDHLRILTKLGLIRPVAGRFSFADLHVVRQVVGELERGHSLGTVLRALASEQGGQLTLDFQSAPVHAERTPARVVSLPSPAPKEMTLFPAERSQQIVEANHQLAAKYFLEGAELDDGEARDVGAASAAYRRALLFEPMLVPALVNLANVHYEQDELVEAEALYEKAVRIDAECFEAYFNLGNIHHDLARYAEAARAYRDALAINPGYPEAHFYLAVTLEKLGRSAEARPHWREYRALAPEGEFAELAREFSD
jgi:tetratricopeptide (TPR) repeat protein